MSRINSKYDLLINTVNFGIKQPGEGPCDAELGVTFCKSLPLGDCQFFHQFVAQDELW